VLVFIVPVLIFIVVDVCVCCTLLAVAQLAELGFIRLDGSCVFVFLVFISLICSLSKLGGCSYLNKKGLVGRAH
jgi:NADH:ubiquinone oxidoreductase subunit 3 (subunit A)